MSRRGKDDFFAFEDDGQGEEDDYGEYDERTMLDDDYGMEDEEYMGGLHAPGPLSGVSRFFNNAFASVFAGASWICSTAKPFMYYGWLPFLAYWGLRGTSQPILALLIPVPGPEEMAAPAQ
jgi:hypothetical protein